MTPVPNLHFVLIVSAVGLIVFNESLYAVTHDRTFSEWGTILMGFLIGKLTNGFGKSMSFSPTVDAADDDDDDDNDDVGSQIKVVSKYHSDKTPAAAHADQAIVSTSPTKDQTDETATPAL